MRRKGVLVGRTTRATITAVVVLAIALGLAGCAESSHRASGAASTIPAAAVTSCPSSAQLLSAWRTAPEKVRQSWASPTVAISGFASIQCWNGWMIAVPEGKGNGYFVFTLSGGLHLLSPAELQEFTSSVCSSSAAPATWKNPMDGPAACQGQ